MLIDIDDREHATILAALRLWEETTNRTEDDELLNVATECGKFAALDEQEIDTLAQKINYTTWACIEFPRVVVHVSGGCVQGAMSNVPELDFQLHDTDNLTDSDYERDERDPPGTGRLSGEECERRWTDLTTGMKPVF